MKTVVSMPRAGAQGLHRCTPKVTLGKARLVSMPRAGAQGLHHHNTPHADGAQSLNAPCWGAGSAPWICTQLLFSQPSPSQCPVLGRRVCTGIEDYSPVLGQAVSQCPVLGRRVCTAMTAIMAVRATKRLNAPCWGAGSAPVAYQKR